MATRDVAGLARVNTLGGLHRVYLSVEGHSWTFLLMGTRRAIGKKWASKAEAGGVTSSTFLYFFDSGHDSTPDLEEGSDERMAVGPRIVGLDLPARDFWDRFQ